MLSSSKLLFCPPLQSPTPGNPRFTSAESLCPFPNKVPFLGAGRRGPEGMRRPAVWGRPLAASSPGLTSGLQVRSPSPWARPSKRGPVGGLGRKRPLSPCPEEPKQVRQSQALGRAKTQVRDPPRRSQRGRRLMRAPGDLDPSSGRRP